MKTKQIASLLISAITLLAASPSTALAQTTGRPDAAGIAQGAGHTWSESKPDLKTVFAKEVAKTRAATFTEADAKRIEKERLDPQSTQNQGGFSKKKALLVVVIIVAITAVAIVLVHNGVEPGPNCEVEITAPECNP